MFLSFVQCVLELLTGRPETVRGYCLFYSMYLLWPDLILSFYTK
jgi:hypothetical protein